MSSAAVDRRSDLYSLGCIFYELCCGRPPFGQGGAELIAAHLRDLPPPPRALAPHLPPALEEVTLRLLDKQPDRRYPSCAALIAALDAAALSSGLAGPGGSQMLPGRGPSGSLPVQLSTMRMAAPSTLGSAAGAAITQPARSRNGLWAALGAVILVGAAVLVLTVVSRSGQPANDPVGAGSSADARMGSVDASLRDSALADAPIEALPQKVARLIVAGAEAMRDRKYDDAHALFEEAYALEHRADALYYMCTTDLLRGHCHDAHVTCKLVTDRFPNDPIAKVAADTDKQIIATSTMAGCYQP